jgi:hypothetical protein
VKRVDSERFEETVATFGLYWLLLNRLSTRRAGGIPCLFAPSMHLRCALPQLDKPLTICAPAQTQGAHPKTEKASQPSLPVDAAQSQMAVLFTKTYGRGLALGLIMLDPKLPDHLKRRNPLATAWRQLDDALRRLYKPPTSPGLKI